MPFKPRYPAWATPAGVFAVTFAVYLRTLCPTVYLVDSGEFITNCRFLGVCHPPGYPVYCLLGRALISIIPFGSTAFRVNLASALYGAAAAVVLYFIVLRMTRRVWIAASVSLSFAFTEVFWSQAVVAEVWTLNLLLISLVLHLFLRWREERSPRRLYLLSLVYGLALANHPTAVFAAPALIIGVFWADPGLIRRPRMLVECIGFFALGLLPYVYLPIRAAAHPPIAWGSPETLANFWHHVTARAYAGRMFTDPPAVVWSRLVHYGNLLLNQFPIWLLWLAPIGAISLRKSDRILAAMLLILITLDVVYTINYRIVDVAPYYLPSWLAIAILIAAGMSYLSQRVRKVFRPAVVSACVLAPLVLVLSNFAVDDFSRETIAHDLAADLLRSVEPDSLMVFCSDATWSAVEFTQMVEGKRHDVLVLDRNLLRAWGSRCDSWCGEWYADSMSRVYPPLKEIYARYRADRRLIREESPLRDVVTREISRRPVYLSCNSAVDPKCDDHPIVDHLRKRYLLVPEGLLYRVLPREAQVDVQALSRRNEQIWSSLSLQESDVEPKRDDSFLREVHERYALMATLAGDVHGNAGRYAVALPCYERALAYMPDLSHARNGLALCYYALGDLRSAAKEWGAVLTWDPANAAAGAGRRLALARLQGRSAHPPQERQP